MSSKKNTTRAALAALVAAATLVSPFSAYAGEGGDGTAGGVGKVSWVYKDNYGTPTRDNAIAAMQSAGVKNLGGTESNKAPRAFIAIVLSQYEPVPADYELGISTQASGTVTQAGSIADVSDRITLSRNGSSISEDVTGKITLHWTGLDGTTRTTSKQFTQNNGSTRSVSFGYRDLDGTWRRTCLRPWRRARRAPPRSGRPVRPAPAFSVLKPCGTFLSSSVLQLQPALCALTGRHFRDAWGRRATDMSVRIPAYPRACPPNHGG